MDKSIYEAHKTQSYTTITIKIKIMNLESLQNLKIMISLILYNFIFFYIIIYDKYILTFKIIFYK
jgi:hypothetical protein